MCTAICTYPNSYKAPLYHYCPAWSGPARPRGRPAGRAGRRWGGARSRRRGRGIPAGVRRTKSPWGTDSRGSATALPRADRAPGSGCGTTRATAADGPGVPGTRVRRTPGRPTWTGLRRPGCPTWNSSSSSG